MGTEHFGLVLPFDTDDKQFVRGVECGRLWEMMKHDRDPFSQTIHATNAEMALRMGEATGRDVRADEIDETWMELYVGPDNG